MGGGARARKLQALFQSHLPTVSADEIEILIEVKKDKALAAPLRSVHDRAISLAIPVCANTVQHRLTDPGARLPGVHLGDRG